MKPLDTIVGVQRISLSLSRTVMLPSLAAAKPRVYRRRPISQMNSLALYSFMASLPLSPADPVDTHSRHRPASSPDGTAPPPHRSRRTRSDSRIPPQARRRSPDPRHRPGPPSAPRG